VWPCPVLFYLPQVLGDPQRGAGVGPGWEEVGTGGSMRHSPSLPLARNTFLKRLLSEKDKEEKEGKKNYIYIYNKKKKKRFETQVKRKSRGCKANSAKPLHPFQHSTVHYRKVQYRTVQINHTLAAPSRSFSTMSNSHQMPQLPQT